MSDSDLCLGKLVETARRIEGREISPVELTSALLQRIDQLDGRLHAYLSVLADRALDRAKTAEQEILAGDYRGPLHGMPVAVKDLCFVAGIPTSCASPVLAGFRPDHDATVVTRLEAAGAVLLGKLNMTEFAMTGYHPDFPIPVNPWRAERWCGGSSSGAGVATAAGLCFGSLGTDTGGSIRFPAAACGVVGLKPSIGRVSRHGVFPLAASLDHVGPLARSTEDAAILLEAISGRDPADATSRGVPAPDCRGDIERGVAGLRLGWDEAYAGEGIAPDVSAATARGLRVLEGLGARVVEVRAPAVDDCVASWAALCAAEAAVAHADTWPSRADDYGASFRSFLEFGARVSGVDYARAHAARLAYAGRLRQLFEQVDALVCPSMPSLPPPVSIIDPHAPIDAGAFELMRWFQRFTAPFNYSGSPTLSLPCGFDPEGIPFSLQLVGRDLDEPLLCRVGHAYERATESDRRHPPV